MLTRPIQGAPAKSNPLENLRLSAMTIGNHEIEPNFCMVGNVNTLPTMQVSFKQLN